MNILIIEDDETLRKQLEEYLSKYDYSVCSCSTIEKAKEIITSPNNIDLCLLDINLPDGNGTKILKLARDKSINIIVTTVKNDEELIVESLDNGASDFLTKPFNLKVLKSRISAVLRDTNKINNNKIDYKNLSLEFNNNIIKQDSKELDLSLKEFNLLALFIKNPSRIFTRNQLLEMFWDDDENFVNDNTLTVCIKRLREKVGKEYIKTVRGIGYRMD